MAGVRNQWRRHVFCLTVDGYGATPEELERIVRREMELQFSDADVCHSHSYEIDTPKRFQ